ncbi:MAG: tRNA pseudouridine(38-40) synthase TruA [Polyangiaceae bacterium]
MTAEADASSKGHVEATAAALVEVAYDGTSFHGYAKQVPEIRTVAATLEHAITSIDPLAGTLRGSSRTDTGVHARAQLVAFDTHLSIPAKGWVLGLNKHLPDDVVVRRAFSVPVGFDPRGFVAWKRYGYRVSTSRVRDPMERNRAWHVHEPIDLERMQRELEVLVGNHDFRAFRSVQDQRTETRRTILEVHATEVDSAIEVSVRGDGFMHNMVRIIVGTAVDVARGRKAPGACARALESGLRTDLGMTAPPQGLTLLHTELLTSAPLREAWP